MGKSGTSETIENQGRAVLINDAHSRGDPIAMEIDDAIRERKVQQGFVRRVMSSLTFMTSR